MVSRTLFAWWLGLSLFGGTLVRWDGGVWSLGQFFGKTLQTRLAILVDIELVLYPQGAIAPAGGGSSLQGNTIKVDSPLLKSTTTPPSTATATRSLVRLTLLVAIVLAVPLVGFAAWAGSLEEWLALWRENPPSPLLLAGILVLLLASDILLPIPSGPLITLAGAQLGGVFAAAAAWLGLMLGGVAAFGLAKRYGRPFAERIASPEDIEALRHVAKQHDVWLLLITRPLPVVAEATVLLLGLLRTGWPRLLGSLGVGNGVVAVVFALLGEYANQSEWLAIAVILSIALPLAAGWVGRKWLIRSTSQSK